ncbi:hypothetical protein [Frigoribacterium sp. VKM Ac-2530]|uniref:hypothetical protein n=1 Tax=Frigoribacterium sp. VKM Ac-2530 TaxID=2783822 RepID=UPI00188D3978|nr:hypothetical protein [Frigoribacterium sp. VKM Ac-2530]MBF4578909.1 hypothetical protein [Frigoribacterium sp. VKM Ac-2530]
MSIGGSAAAFDFAAPVGVRTSRNVGRISADTPHEWLNEDISSYVEEENDLRSNRLHPAMTRPQHLDALAKVESLKRRAANGQLTVGYEATHLARQMRRCDYIIELRPGMQRDAERVVRLYYAEPEARANTLLPLLLDTKPSGGDPGGEQNDSIDLAESRSQTWTLMKQPERSEK